jgi:hypothetical protein
VSPRLLIPNVAAEEGSKWRELGRLAAVQNLVRLWRLLFGPDQRLATEAPHEASLQWPAGLGPRPEAPVFAWLDSEDLASAWLNTEEAAGLAAEAGTVLSGPTPECVARVHDKAFAHHVASDEGLLPDALRDVVLVLDPSELIANDAAARIGDRIAAWPEWLGGRFALKPRFGSSGRGRFGGALHAIDPEALGSTLQRLAARGGAILEPWLDRRDDLSVQLSIDRHGEILVLGSLAQRVSPSGVYRGHQGIVDARGRVRSNSPWDERVREAAVQVALRARQTGFHGPCGVDAFTFGGDDGTPQLRSVVELNARFTSGIVVLGLVRRALAVVGPRLGLAPGTLLAFDFELQASDPLGATSPDTESLSLVPTPGQAGPRLRFSRAEIGA